MHMQELCKKQTPLDSQGSQTWKCTVWGPGGSGKGRVDGEGRRVPTAATRAWLSNPEYQARKCRADTSFSDKSKTTCVYLCPQEVRPREVFEEDMGRKVKFSSEPGTQGMWGPGHGGGQREGPGQI